MLEQGQNPVGRWNDLGGGKFYGFLECVLMYNAPFYITSRRTLQMRSTPNKLFGEERTLHAAARQKESKLGGIASTDFQNKSFLT